MEEKKKFSKEDYEKIKRDIIAGSASGAISGALVHPLDN